MSLKEGFYNAFHYKHDFIYSCGGRVELLGNHTDHNHGKCMALTANLCITAAVKKNNDNIVNFYSEGFPPFKVDLSSFTYDAKENKSGAMVRGVARYLKEHGYNIGGFDVYSSSTIFKGAGLSSSAAFELLIAGLFNELYNDNSIPKITLCKAGQYSENNYYGKKSGLLDQIGVAFGNIVAIDFVDIDNPKVTEVTFPFDDLHFVIINTGGDHSSLNDLYSSIPTDMWNAANKCGHKYLVEGNMEEIKKNKDKLTELEFSRAKHFYSENKRVEDGVNALKNRDKQAFLDAVNGSCISSTNDLKNMMVPGKYVGSPLEAIDRAKKIMNGEGAARINGGGFAGSIIAIVPSKKLNVFIRQMGEYYGSGNVCEVFPRKQGPSID